MWIDKVLEGNYIFNTKICISNVYLIVYVILWAMTSFFRGNFYSLKERNDLENRLCKKDVVKMTKYKRTMIIKCEFTLNTYFECENNK